MISFQGLSRTFARALYGRNNGQVGIVTPTGPVWAISTQALAANTARYGRFVPDEDILVGGISFVVTTIAGADDSVDVGIYNSSLSTVLKSSGATSGKLLSLGVKNITFAAPVQLRGGTVYYSSLACGTLGAGAGTLAALSYSLANTGTIFGTAAGLAEAFAASTAYPLAAAPTAIATPNVYLLALIPA